MPGDSGSSIFGLLLPDALDLSWAAQSLADCGDCVMLSAKSGEGPERAFHPDVRCCSFHPDLPNFLVGRALRRGGDARRVLMARLADPSGVSAWGVQASDGWRSRHDASPRSSFGREVALRCPYWVGGDFACGVWPDRPSTCQTWFCKHDRGQRGLQELSWLRTALLEIEHRVGDLCAASGGAPDPAEATPDQWAAWFVRCADRSEQLSAAELAALRTPWLAEAARELAELRQARPAELPPILVPSVSGVWRLADRFRVAGYSDYDAADVPAGAFELLARLDGTRPWAEALADANRVAGGGLDEALVAELVRVNALRVPSVPGDGTDEHRIGVLGASWTDAGTRDRLFGAGG